MPERRIHMRRKEDKQVTHEQQTAIVGAIKWLGALVVVLLLAVSVLSVAAFKRSGDVQSNTELIGKLQAVDRVTARQLNYGSCQRANLTRAEIHQTLKEAIGLKALRLRQARIPIVDCAPLLKGRSTFALPIKEQEQFVAYFVRCEKIPPIKQGKVDVEGKHCLR